MGLRVVVVRGFGPRSWSCHRVRRLRVVAVQGAAEAREGLVRVLMSLRVLVGAEGVLMCRMLRLVVLLESLCTRVLKSKTFL